MVYDLAVALTAGGGRMKVGGMVEPCGDVMVNKKPTIWWLRQDLRLGDQPALQWALARGGPVIPVFIWAPEEEKPWSPGGASRWWWHHSLTAFGRQLEGVGSRLVIRRGPTREALLDLAREAGAGAVAWNRRYEPAVIARDQGIKQALAGVGLETHSGNAALLFEPWTVANKAGKPFQVFTPFWRHCLALPEPAAPWPAPRHVPAPARWPGSLAVEALELRPRVAWDTGLREAWRPGSEGARGQLERFLRDGFATYGVERDRPDRLGTSRLSPHLHFGEISPRQVWAGVRAMAEKRGLAEAEWRASRFLAELGWREFAHHLLYHFPHTPNEPLRPEFVRFPWRREEAWQRAWEKGRTGYPIVDAGMRELWRTGWMHNRVRMIVASFLVKDLLVNWVEGARWFWDTLVDADLAQNTLGWQWTAGCGADAAPYFRVFNPTSQGEKFDPEGEYVRRWVPELARLPAAWIHRPHEAPPSVLAAGAVRPGENYPFPMVSHAVARNVALEAFGRLKA